MKDVTAPVPVPTDEISLKTVSVQAAHAVGYTVLGGGFLLVFLLFLSAMFGLFFTYAPWLLVLAFFGWPIVRLMHVTGRWVAKNSHRV